MENIAKRALTLREFCQAYGVSRTTTYRQITAGNLRTIKLGKRTLIAADDAEAWLRSLQSAA
jgi:excisionase family DNA binding protein